MQSPALRGAAAAGAVVPWHGDKSTFAALGQNPRCISISSSSYSRQSANWVTAEHVITMKTRTKAPVCILQHETAGVDQMRNMIVFSAAVIVVTGMIDSYLSSRLPEESEKLSCLQHDKQKPEQTFKMTSCSGKSHLWQHREVYHSGICRVHSAEFELPDSAGRFHPIFYVLCLPTHLVEL